MALKSLVDTTSSVWIHKHTLSEAAKWPDDDHWCTAAADLCGKVYVEFAEHKHKILQSFHQWGDTPMPPPSGGQNFMDCFWYFGEDEKGTKVSEQRRKSPKNNYYGTIPCKLGFKPAQADVDKMFRAIAMHFSGTQGAIETLLSMQCFTVRGKAQPDKILIPVDFGGTGKSLIYETLGRALWGQTFGSCPSSMLQVPEEFRKQGHNLIWYSWLNFDESKPSSGLEEEIFKLLLSGGFLALRRNHEAETTYYAWPWAGKTHPMNDGDIPWVPTAEDECFLWRICVYRTRCILVLRSEDVDPSKHKYLSDPTLKAFLSSEVAACIWWKYLALLQTRSQLC